MGWTKQELIVQAYEMIGIASYVYDLSPEQLQSAMRQLNLMMATWNSQGLRLGYALSSTATGGSLSDQAGVPDRANEAIVANLALRLAPGFGKTPTPELKTLASLSLDALFAWAAIPPTMQMPSGMPAGAGSKPWRDNGSPFLDEPVDPIVAGPDGDLEVQ